MRPTHWPPRELRLLERRLNELELLVREDRSMSSDVRDWLARLLVVRSCGYLEQVVLAVQREYVEQKSGGLVKTFAHSWLERSRNPRPDVLLGTVGRFSARLEYELEEFLRDTNTTLWSDLAFLVDRRNKIAHGENESVGPARALQLKGTAVDVADWFIRRLNADP